MPLMQLTLILIGQLIPALSILLLFFCRCYGLAVEREVLLRGAVPAPVHPHSLLYELLPEIGLLPVVIEGAVQSVIETLRATA
jgi:hypothetical protein